MVAEGRAEMDEAEVAFDRALLQKRGQIRRRAIRELERAAPHPVKLRKLASIVLGDETVLSKSLRGAGSWATLSKREPKIMMALTMALRGSRRVKVDRNAVASLARRKSEKNK